MPWLTRHLAFLIVGAGIAVLSLKGQPSTDAGFLTELEQADTRFFIEQARPGGLMPVAWSMRSGPDPRASASATGFELAALCIADRHGWIARATALRRTIATLTTACAAQNAHPETMGLLYHFMRPDGLRYGDSEVGTDDGSKLIDGALVARQYFDDPTVTRLADRLYAGVNWRLWIKGSDQQAYLAWRPGRGFSPATWGRYSEGPIQVYLLGMGSPVPSRALSVGSWNSWRRSPVNSYAGYRWVGDLSALFAHQYPEAFFDFRGLTDNSSRGAGISYWKDCVAATLAQWQWSQDLGHRRVDGAGPFPHWGVDLWGLTSSRSQSGAYAPWGGPGSSKYRPDGTLTPAAAGGSIPFAPRECLRTLEYMRAHYPAAWTRYGFVDAFNPENGWVDDQLLTNHTGQTLLMAENQSSGLIWKLFMSCPEIIRAMKIAGFAGRPG